MNFQNFMNKPKMFMLCGLPASGKSEEAKRIAKTHNATIHSSDSIREELSGDESDQGNNQEVFSILHKRVKQDLLDGKNVIYDATNINYKLRKAFLAELKKIECEKIAILMATKYEDCLLNNSKRSRNVPEHVIKKMYMNFNIPYWYEGWDDIRIVYNSSCENGIYDFLDLHKDFNQSNSHHTTTLSEHSWNTYNLIQEPDLKLVGLFHDIGKPFTKTFFDSKRNPSVEAHYYQHHLTGAYDSMFYFSPYSKANEVLEFATIIQWHMQPYFWERDKTNGEKQRLKYLELWGEDLYNKIMMLHEADKNAH